MILPTPSSLSTLARRGVLEARSLGAMTRAGVLPLTRPDHVVGLAGAMRRYGPFGGAVAGAAIAHRDQPAIADERGTVTYAELDEMTNRLANVLRARMLPGQTVGLLCRNHRSPLVVAFAASRAGLNTVWLNTSFSPRQAQEVTARERIDLVFADADLAGLVADVEVPVVIADIAAATDELTELIATGDPAAPPAPARPGRIVLLTSGTTGTPKGAPRAEPKGYTLPGSLLDRMPMRSRETTLIAPPIFHGVGLIMTMIALALGNKVVLRRSFDAETLLADIAEHRAATICVVPVMMQRVLALAPATLDTYDTSSLRVAFCSGSALPGEVSRQFQDRFGEVIYNLYGSTEVSVATIATPADVRDHPTSVGCAALGSRVAILDDSGRPVPQGGRGRIFVGTVTPFEGYTGGGGKEIIDGMLATGDVGHLDEAGRLYVDGRDDDMIVSGGENVFPAEVEELLIAHPAVREVAVVGVPDEEFGARLSAFVALHDGAALSVEEVQEHVRVNLARYKVPRAVTFLESLPRNPTGKVLKRELAKAAAS